MLGDLDNALVQFAWTFSASGTKRQLAKPWAASATVSTNDAMVVTNGPVGSEAWMLVASSGGTTGTVTPTPPTANGGTVADNGVTWIGYRFTGIKFLTVVNQDSANVSMVGDVNLQLIPVPSGYGSSGPLAPTPMSLYAVSASGASLAVVVSA